MGGGGGGEKRGGQGLSVSHGVEWLCRSVAQRLMRVAAQSLLDCEN